MNAMNDLVDAVLWISVLWRAVLGALAGALAALLTSLVVSGLPGGAWFAFVAAGTALGLAWQLAVACMHETSSAHTSGSVSAPVAFLGIAFVGGLWGWLVASVAGVPVALLALTLAPGVLGWCFGRLAKRNIGLGDIAFATIASWIGVATPLALRLGFGAFGN